MVETQRAGRRGRPWGALQGDSTATNDLARLLRDWLDAAGMSLNGLYARLVPEYFPTGQVPSRSTIARRLSGAGLENDWAFVEAVADLTTADAPGRTLALAHARRLWGEARRTSTTTAGGSAEDGEGSPTAMEAEALDGSRRFDIQNATFNGSVHITNNHYTAVESAELQDQLLDARRRLVEALDQLNDARRELAAVKQELEQMHRARERLQRAGAVPDPKTAVEDLRRSLLLLGRAEQGDA
ncbi:hypothetical protein [Streptomyces luteireticuli]|uniref:hypothetical protein n=1 Tax=Streptomyces luteireticuli TaxID=173858 RepID=UPI003556914E